MEAVTHYGAFLSMFCYFSTEIEAYNQATLIFQYLLFIHGIIMPIRLTYIPFSNIICTAMEKYDRLIHDILYTLHLFTEIEITINTLPFSALCIFHRNRQIPHTNTHNTLFNIFCLSPGTDTVKYITKTNISQFTPSAVTLFHAKKGYVTFFYNCLLVYMPLPHPGETSGQENLVHGEARENVSASAEYLETRHTQHFHISNPRMKEMTWLPIFVTITY